VSGGWLPRRKRSLVVAGVLLLPTATGYTTAAKDYAFDRLDDSTGNWWRASGPGLESGCHASLTSAVNAMLEAMANAAAAAAPPAPEPAA
jgi:hypothetical protein